jgi:dihydrofolate reductase
MYPGYEAYWTAIQSQPDKPHPMTDKLPTSGELEWSRFAAKTPHHVLSNTLSSALWPNTHFVRAVADVAALKQHPGKDIYLLGGARTTASLLDAGLVDELRLLVYPLVAGDGKALFATAERRHGLELRKVQQHADGRVGLIYEIRSAR